MDDLPDDPDELRHRAHTIGAAGHDATQWPRLGRMTVRVAAYDDSDPTAVVLGLAEYPDGSSEALLFMPADDEPSGQGIALGMDTYCLVREPQLGTTYDGMSACRLQDRQLRLAFTAEAAEELCVEAIVEIDLHLDEDGLAIPQRGLRQVLLSGRPDQHPALTGV